MTEYTTTPGDLLCNDYPVAIAPITLISGQDLARGAVLGKITASGKYTLSLAAAGDGSETPSLVLAVACDASAGDVTTSAYVSGAFDASKLVLGAGVTAADLEAEFRSASSPMYVKTLA